MAVSQRSAEVIRPDFGFLGAVEAASEQVVSSCFRCLKCSSGCPMAAEMDYPPDRLIRMVQLGLRDEVLGSKAIWLCTSCITCSERCPNGIDVARVVDSLKKMAGTGGGTPGEPNVAGFHRSFLSVVKRYGRLHEATLIALLKLNSRDWFADVPMGVRMFLKGKIPLFPQRVRGGDQVARLFSRRAAGESRPSERGG